jgi:hypothetical protein
MDPTFPRNYNSGDFFLYIYQHKRAYHIRVATSIQEIEPNYYRSARRIAYNTTECEALGLTLYFLQKYYNASRNYFHALMGINQNKPHKRTSEFEMELMEPFREHMESVRKHRLNASRTLKHRSWSDLAILRKQARAVLPAPIPEIVFPSTKGLYS